MSEYKQNGNGKLVIESGIPLFPAGNNKIGLKEALLELKIGDSFVYPKTKRCSVLPCAQRYGVKIVTRSISDAEIRVWRIE